MSDVSHVRPVILSGGSGTRLWPLSRDSRPKQFLELVGEQSLFEKTLTRLMSIPGADRPLIVTGEAHLAATLAILGDLDAHVVVEPQGRNTAAAITAAAVLLPPDDLMVISPSDHLVGNAGGFVDAVGKAISIAARGGIGTLGVVPDRPETGFGYIQLGEAKGSGFEIARFVEKPSQDVAAAMIDGHDILWNAGIFVGQAREILEETRRLSPAIVSSVEAAVPAKDTTVTRLGRSFLEAPDQPFDRAVMERTQLGFVVAMDADWSDVGSWNSVWQAADKDGDGNAVWGDAEVADSTDSYVWASSRPVLVLGVSGLAIVDTDEGLLVATLDRSQEVREVVELLRKRSSADGVG